MFEKLLTISETAKLIGVCENTLREWDESGKFKAERTGGGHRRYALDDVRDYLGKNPPAEEPKPSITISNPTDRWKDSEYLQGYTDRYDKIALAVLLDNAKHYAKHYEAMDTLPLDQTLWLTQQAWVRTKFRKMVHVNPLQGPCDMVYYSKLKPDNRGGFNLAIESEPVAAKTTKYDFKIFSKDFDKIKDVYADVMAAEIDMEIFKHLPTVSPGQLLESDRTYDYVIGPECVIDELPSHKFDLYEIPPMLHRDYFEPLVAAGKYPNRMDLPIFCPYILFMVSPSLNMTRSVLMRTAWLT